MIKFENSTGWKRLTFCGHPFFPTGLWTVISLGTLAPAIAISYLSLAQTQEFWIKIAIYWMTLLFMPNSLYMALEIKHLVLQRDGIAIGRPLTAIVGFGLISLIGLFCSVATILIFISIVPELTDQKIPSIILLSFLSALGAVFGLQDHTTLVGMLVPPIILLMLKDTLKNRNYVLLIIGLTSGLSVLTYCASLFVTL